MYRACLLISFSLFATAPAQETHVYYDYVENGELRGGRFTVDPTDAEQRRMFGLDGPAVMAAGTWAVESIVNNGPSDNRVDIVILGDGYTAGELSLYSTNVDTVVGSFLAEEPFAAYATYFNVHRVDVISTDSGVDELDIGVFKNTALDMAYGCFGIDRLLCINVGLAAGAAASAPDVDQILALANSTRYGGAGYSSNNLGTLAGRNSGAIEIALHEFGHSFGDLADEYNYGGPVVYIGGEPTTVNVSIFDAAAQQSQQQKWYRWLDLPTVGTFEGAAYSEQGIYRPTFNSKMRALNRPFEAINVEQLVVSTYETVSPIDDSTPAGTYSACQQFVVTPMAPADHALDIQWSIDGADVAGAIGQSFSVDSASLSVGTHAITVTVIDNTPRVRDETLRSQWMTASRSWTIDVLGIPDECACPPPETLTPEPEPVTRNRYLAITIPPPVPFTDQAIRVRATDLGPFGALNGETWWLGPPETVSDSAEPTGSFTAARLQCAPTFMDWSAVGAVYAYGPEIVPDATYELQRVDVCCGSLEDESCYGPSIAVVTATWGDVVAPFGGGGQPDFVDVGAVVDSFAEASGSPGKTRADLVPEVLDHAVDFVDISMDVDAFAGVAYPFAGPVACPLSGP